MFGFKRINRFAGRGVRQFLVLAFCWGGLVSCSGELTSESALEQIAAQAEFRMPYYAPMRVGEVVLTGDNHKDSKGYIRKHYGPLIDAGLAEVAVADRNTWRTVIDVRLSEKARAMVDGGRSTEREAYVPVCRMAPVRIDEFRTLSEEGIVECAFTFEERDITPFGLCKGFQQGREYKDKRTFVKARGSWHVK